MVRKVVYDCKKPEDAPAEAIDGSDELLPEADRVTEADLAHEFAGALRRIQDRRKREAAKKVSE